MMAVKVKHYNIAIVRLFELIGLLSCELFYIMFVFHTVSPFSVFYMIVLALLNTQWLIYVYHAHYNTVCHYRACASASTYPQKYMYIRYGKVSPLIRCLQTDSGMLYLSISISI